MNETNKKSIFKNLNPYEMGIYLVFLCLVIVITILTGGVFLNVKNITNVLRQTVWTGIIALGSIFVFSLGGIDLSVGSTYAVCAMVAALLLERGINVFVAVIASIIVGGILGLFNGLLIYKLEFQPFIATMASMTITRGVLNVVTKGCPVTGFDAPGFIYVGQGYVGIFPIPVLIAIVLLAFSYYLMNWTRFGRYCLSIGSNEEASALVGVNVHKIGIIAYVYTGIMCALSGLLATARLEGAMPTAGEGYELDVIAACVIGGTSLSGGKASVIGAMIGALLMAIVRNGLNLVGVSTFWHNVVMGVIIIIAVLVDKLGRKRERKIRK